ncbi:hypothetical protein [Ruegeria sp. YS9]|uniref:hypothetical protein n=1 Tax=Ruegeria sp. YS9 TaxID=2966453 RepID=UPI00214CF628|nr:hypothetical protein [Ruegeria sp. YS9]UUV08707.1 hypothetical protein NOR97_20750 [Ruegeria sp. YS9]
MARKKKPKIAGSDPAYTSDFSEFNKLPTNKPPEIQEPEPQPVQPQEPKPETTTAPTAARTRKPRAKPAAAAPVRKQAAPVPKKDLGPKRELTLIAAVKMDQHSKLEALENKGLPQKDIIALAGRRAIERFDPKPEFVEKPEADRRPMREGYKSTKRVDTALLEKLRDKHDPLRVSSDAAMVRGQFEILFWSCLDEVIEELNSKY